MSFYDDLRLDEGWTPFYWTSQDGLRLHARDYGSRQLPHTPVVCLPGLTRNAKDFHALALHLSTHKHRARRVVCFDYRGRGQSEWDRDWQNYNPAVEAQDILSGIVAAGLTHASVVGTSRGGIIAMILGSLRPGILESVVLNDVGPVIDYQGLMRIKGYVGKVPPMPTWQDALEQVRTATIARFPALDEDDWRYHVGTTFRDDEGRPKSDYDPDLARTLAALDGRAPLPDLWPQFRSLGTIPSLILRGENSDILTTETAQQMLDAHSKAEFLEIAGQGHAPILHKTTTLQAIAAFLSRVEGKNSAHRG